MTRTYTAPIRSAQAAASRRLILDAALRLFSRDGYAATTLTAVAEEAGLAAETIYKHFQNKPNVLQQLLLWLPNLVVALVVLVIGGLAAKALSQLVRGATAEAGFSNPDTMATVTRVAVWGFTIVVGIQQIWIA
jgi:AcrR family transcriptional regulator